MPEDDAPAPILAPLQQSNNDSDSDPHGLLTLKDVAEATGVKYGRLRGFADIDGIGAYLGAVDVKGVKGVRYEARAVEQFRRLADAQDAGVITPKTAKTWLANLLETPPADVTLSPVENGRAETPRLSNADGNAALSQSRAGPLLPLLERLDRLIEARIPPAEDRLIGREEAAHLLACSPANVSRYVRPVRRSTWRRSDVLAYIANL